MELFALLLVEDGRELGLALRLGRDRPVPGRQSVLRRLDQDAAPIVRAHQERFDCAMDETRYPGYPMGLSGDHIPLGARIIAVVDAFDAMTTTRPYRQAFAMEEAVNIIRNERGKQFDPRVVDAFLDCLVERPWHRS